MVASSSELVNITHISSNIYLTYIYHKYLHNEVQEIDQASYLLGPLPQYSERDLSKEEFFSLSFS